MIQEETADAAAASLIGEGIGEIMLKIQNPYAPQEGDANLKEEEAYVHSVDWDEYSNTLAICGELPTPCNEVRVAVVQDDIYELSLEVYSVRPLEDDSMVDLDPFGAVLYIDNFLKEDCAIIVNGLKFCL